jgi:hypothetical protein
VVSLQHGRFLAYGWGGVVAGGCWGPTHLHLRLVVVVVDMVDMVVL